MYDLYIHGVTICLKENTEYDLKHILGIIGNIGEKSYWKICDAECLGASVQILHTISDERKIVSGKQFYEIVQSIYQTIDGVFEAYKQGKAASWLSIRAIRADEFDIETDDKELLNKIRGSFPNVIDLVY